MPVSRFEFKFRQTDVQNLATVYKTRVKIMKETSITFPLFRIKIYRQRYSPNFLITYNITFKPKFDYFGVSNRLVLVAQFRYIQKMKGCKNANV